MYLFIAVPLKRNAFDHKSTFFACILGQNWENVTFDIPHIKLNTNIGYREISAVVRIILDYLKSGTKILGNDP